MGSLSLDSQVEIISVHVHKTAGGTFGRVLQQVYGSDKVFNDYQELPIENVMLNLSAQPQVRAIHGHFAARKYKKYFPSAKRIIWLRNPIIQFISGYFFWKSQPLKNGFFSQEHKYMVENSLSLWEFAERRSEKDANCLNYFYCRDVNLTDFYFVGIQEFFEDDLAELKQMLGWSKFKKEVFNQNKYPNYRDRLKEALEDKKEIELLINILHKDLEIYQKALDMRAKRKMLSNLWEQYALDLKDSQQKLQHIQVELERKQSFKYK